MKDKKVQVWAHRGASGYVPENTIEAFRKAVEMGADGVELDVQLSKDGELVVIHDETLDRVSGISGNVRDFTLSELKEIDVCRAIEGYHTVRIPTLQEVLEELRPTGLSVNIECKTGLYFYPGLEEKVNELVGRLGMEDRIWISSFNHKSVLRMKMLRPEIKAGFLVQDVLADAAGYARYYGVEALHPACYHMQDAGLIEHCKKQGVKVHLWTVNDRADMERYARAGVDALITNYPDQAREVVDHL